MSGWNWALMALSGHCGAEMALAGLDLAAKVENQEAAEQEAVLELPMHLHQDDAAPVLKVYYDAQPG
jgi:hypothetical protein